MRVLSAIPLMIVPLALYNIFAFGLSGDPGGDIFAATVFSVNMLSGATWSMSMGDMLILVGLVFLFVEILKSTRTGSHSVLDHLLSTLVFVAFLVEFLLVRQAATHVFFILMTVAFIDLIAGFSVSIRSSGRDVSIGL